MRRVKQGRGRPRGQSTGPRFGGSAPDTLMNDAFPLLACLGGSAGGLEADALLLHEIPARTALALVVVNHRCRAESFLPHLLACHTKLPVSLAAAGVQVRPGQLYVVPPGRELTLSGGAFVLHGLPTPHGESTVISVFLESVAREWQGPVVAVILSGRGADGADALHSIKAAGGLTFAQAPDTALCPGMPRCAVASGSVDFVLPPEAIGRALAGLTGGPPFFSKRGPAPGPSG
jgi:two-component system, chemotaxis family, protein-glutamate methylesterase/glutaminase